LLFTVLQSRSTWLVLKPPIGGVQVENEKKVLENKAISRAAPPNVGLDFKA